MPINMECPQCHHTTTVAEHVSAESAKCQRCQATMKTQNALPAADVMSMSVPPEPQGLRFESVVAMAALGLMVMVLVLFYTRFHG